MERPHLSCDAIQSTGSHPDDLWGKPSITARPSENDSAVLWPVSVFDASEIRIGEGEGGDRGRVLSEEAATSERLAVKRLPNPYEFGLLLQH